jgi:hypothetical protein
MNIFISFCGEDGAFFANKITEAAAKRGDKAFGVDLKNVLGSEASDPDALYKALYSPAFSVILLSGRYILDGWFYPEVVGLMALEQKLNREFVLTVLLEDLPPEQIPYPLRHKVHFDWTGEKEQAGLEALMERIGSGNAYQLSKVFIVHGHDEGLKDATARLLKEFSIDATILSEKLPGGDTIIEKFELYADAHFALALLTPDDLGKRNDPQGNEKPRARQNVILELGYFIGKLGRRRVLALCKGDIELPSDLHGIEYVPVDSSGAWKTTVAHSLKAAGFRIDLNTRL